MLDTIKKTFKDNIPSVDFCSLRFVREEHDLVSVRQDVPEPRFWSENAGVMITIHNRGGTGYAATCNLSEAGVKQAIREAADWADRSAGWSVIDFSKVPCNHPKGAYRSPNEKPWKEVPLQEKIDLLMQQNKKLKIDDRIVDWQAGLWYSELESVYLTSEGGEVSQQFFFLVPNMHAISNRNAETQTRSFGGLRENCRQGGMEVLEGLHFTEAPHRIAEESLALLDAPNCPAGKRSLLLGADQMILQIHESIGHPLELDRILGDERNYAGTSFVTLDMFGSYRYGSELLNITYDPSMANQFASFGFDDEGLKAEKTFIIKDGILVCPLGGTTSQYRAKTGGVANCRACSWNRPPIDRMANLNLEPGKSTLEGMIAQVEDGIYMQTNRSWSIDDSRNKFQFGCEWGQEIKDGKLKGLVKNPNYRGISATFWRNLAAVGDRSSFQLMGTPFCGKGEPNQAIRVGHASPACLFKDVEIFGGDA